MTAELDRFETMLADEHDYLMGSDFSTADCCAFPFVKCAPQRTTSPIT